MAGPTQRETMAVAAGLVFHRGRLLLSQRRAGDHLGGLWEFPGGKIEPGESAAACLQRELREELAIEVEVNDRVAIVEHAYPERHVRLHFYRCRLRAGQPRAVGCQAFAWVTAEELTRYDFPAADAGLIVRLVRERHWWVDSRP